MSRFSPTTTAAAGLLCAAAIAACGSNSPRASDTGHRPNAREAPVQTAGLSYARCMRSHGVTHFPDPSPSGGFNLNVPGISRSSPVVQAAETACATLLPVKHPANQQPTAAAYHRLLAWSECMRRHGIVHLSDPRPDPPPAPGSDVPYGTLMGDGGYWVGIPISTDAHSPAFMRMSTRCGENPNPPHHS